MARTVVITKQGIPGSAATGYSPGGTDVAVSDGGTGASSAAAARTNLGLGNVDNTSDANKPVSTAQQTAINSVPLPRKHSILATDSPKTHTNFATTVGFTTGQPLNLQRISSGAQNAFIEWDITMDAGTWTFDLFYRKDASYGIYTVSVDGVSVGTIDGYAAAAANGTISSLTGISVSRGIHAIRLTMATKNASSSNYTALFQTVSLVRTGA